MSRRTVTEETGQVRNKMWEVPIPVRKLNFSYKLGYVEAPRSAWQNCLSLSKCCMSVDGALYISYLLMLPVWLCFHLKRSGNIPEEFISLNSHA